MANRIDFDFELVFYFIVGEFIIPCAAGVLFSISGILFSSETIGKIDYSLNVPNLLNLETNEKHQVH